MEVITTEILATSTTTALFCSLVFETKGIAYGTVTLFSAFAIASELLKQVCCWILLPLYTYLEIRKLQDSFGLGLACQRGWCGMHSSYCVFDCLASLYLHTTDRFKDVQTLPFKDVQTPSCRRFDASAEATTSDAKVEEAKVVTSCENLCDIRSSFLSLNV